MKTFLQPFVIASIIVGISGCGQKSDSMGLSKTKSVTSSPAPSKRSLGNTVLTSGTAGSPRNAINSGTGQAASTASSVSGASSSSTFNAAANAFSGVDFWGNLVQNTATDPQQCADLYNKYQRYPGNFESAFSVLAGCLNRVMVVKNPNLFQSYVNLYQQQNSYSPYSYY